MTLSKNSVSWEPFSSSFSNVVKFEDLDGKSEWMQS